MGRAIPPERHSPHHLKEQHHIRGSITQGTPAPTPTPHGSCREMTARWGGVPGCRGNQIRAGAWEGLRTPAVMGTRTGQVGRFSFAKRVKCAPRPPPIPRTPFIEHLLCAWRWPQRCLYVTLRDGLEKKVPWAGGLGVRYLGSRLVGSWRAAAANPGRRSVTGECPPNTCLRDLNNGRVHKGTVPLNIEPSAMKAWIRFGGDALRVISLKAREGGQCAPFIGEDGGAQGGSGHVIRAQNPLVRRPR